MKSSTMVGGAQLVRMLIGAASAKFAAILIGPAGIGLIGAYQSIIRLGIQISGLGINQSGVRDVAASSGTGDEQAIARTIFILRRLCWLTGLLGAAGLASLAIPVSLLSFGDSSHKLALMLLSLVILVTAISQGQMAVIQGLRRITDLVRIQIIGSVSGAIASIILYATIGKAGIVPALLAIALFNLVASWWFSRRLFPTFSSMHWREFFSGAKSLIGMGTAFMVGGLASSFTAYTARALIAHDLGINALGIYHSAFSISAYVLHFVLGAMGADFYPRLASNSDDHDKINRLVNEQTEVGLLLAAPALVGIIGLAPLVINILYSAQFSQAVELLRWFVLGCFLRVISWPMGFVQLAKGEKYWYFFSQITFNVLHIALIFAGLHIFGLCGSAIAFFSMYVLHILGMRLIAGHLIGFSWSIDVIRLILCQVSFVAVMFLSTFVFSEFWNIVLGSAFSAVLGVFSLRQLLIRLGEGHRVFKIISNIPVIKWILLL